MSKNFTILLIFIFITNCSFHKNSEFWNNQKIEEETKENLTEIFKKKETLNFEFNPTLKIELDSRAVNNSVLNSLDNNLIENQEEINQLFDEVINKTKLDKEIKNLNIYKKGLFNSNFVSENELLMILNPLINSESIWKSHALYLIAEYFYSKGEKQKAKEFFNQILSLPEVNTDIKSASQKRINRDLSE